MRVFATAAALLGAAIASVSQAQTPAAERMFQALPAAACAAPLGETGKPLQLPEELSDSERGALLSAIFLTLHDPAGNDAWPEKELETALPCPVARFAGDNAIWTLNAGGAGLPVRWARAPDGNDFFYLVQGPALADAEAWDRAGRRGLPGLGTTPAYYLVGRTEGMNYVMQAYDGPPATRMLAEDLAAIIEGERAPLAVHDPVGDAISLYVTTKSLAQAEIFRPQDIGASQGSYAAIYFPDGHFFTFGEDFAYVMRGSGFACAEAFGPFERHRVGIHQTDDADLDLSCAYSGSAGLMTLYVSRLPSTTEDKARWNASIASFQKETGATRKLSSPKMGPKETFQAGGNWMDRDGNMHLVFFMRRGDYVIQILQSHDQQSVEGAAQALMQVVNLVDLPDARSADGWRARR